MTIRRTDPTGQFTDGAAAIIELATMDARIAAFQQKFPADFNGQQDLRRHATDCSRRAKNCST